MIRSILTTSLLLSLAGCGKTVIDSSCASFQPIHYSASKDRPELVQKIREHNAVWVALCG